MSEVRATTPDIHSLPDDLAILVPRWSKSSVIRWIMLDSKLRRTDIADAIETAHRDAPLGEDIEAAIRVSRQLISGEALEPGDSRTLLVMTRMLLWSSGLQRDIILTPMQAARNTIDLPEVATWPLEDLASLSGKSTQFPSAAILLQDRDPDEVNQFIAGLPPEKRPMVELTRATKAAWLSNRALGKPFSVEQLQPEHVLQGQALHHYREMTTGEVIQYHAEHSEQAIYAVFHGDMTLEEAERRFPMLRNHETDRIEEMKKVLRGGPVDSIDHRIVQAALLTGVATEWTERSERAVRKTWPQFFEFYWACLADGGE